MYYIEPYLHTAISSGLRRAKDGCRSIKSGPSLKIEELR